MPPWLSKRKPHKIRVFHLLSHFVNYGGSPCCLDSKQSHSLTENRYREPINPTCNNMTKRAIEPHSRSQSRQKGATVTASIVDLQTITNESPIIRPLRFAGADVWIRFNNKAEFDRAQPILDRFLQPLNGLEARPLRHWTVRTKTKPIKAKVYLTDTGQVLTADCYHFDIEQVEDVIETFGKDNVKVTCTNIATS